MDLLHRKFARNWNAAAGLHDVLSRWLRPSPETIAFSFPFLYAVLFYTDMSILDGLPESVVSLLLSTYENKDLDIILKRLGEKPIDYKKRFNRMEMFSLLCQEIQRPCALSNFFLQDIFTPSSIFKETYRDDVYIDHFMTSLYYLTGCRFPTKNVPLRAMRAVGNKMHFPMDVDPREWNRPCMLVDVSNQFHGVPGGNAYANRVAYLRTHLVDILGKLFGKNRDPDLMVLFVHQADLSDPDSNCTTIEDLSKSLHGADKRLVNGTVEDPMNRVVLYITVPCNLFLYPELVVPDRTVVTRPFWFNMGPYDPAYPGTSSSYAYQTYRNGRPPLQTRQAMRTTRYDKYGRLLAVRDPVLRPSNIDSVPHRFYPYGASNIVTENVSVPAYEPYQRVRVNPPSDPAQRARWTPPVFRPKTRVGAHALRHAVPDQARQGQNTNQGLVERGSGCAGKRNLGKNEIDDYMIALLLLLHHKSYAECEESRLLPFLHRWVLFSADRYRWMNPLYYTHVVRNDNFLAYLEPTNTTVLRTLVPNPQLKNGLEELGLLPFGGTADEFRQLLSGCIWRNRRG